MDGEGHEQENQRDQIKRLLGLLGFKNEKAFTKYMDNLFEPITVPEEDVDRYVSGMMSNQRKLANYPFTMTEEKFYKLFKNSVKIKKSRKFPFFGKK